MKEWQEVSLGSESNIISQKTAITNATLDNYISTDNMLPYFGGIRKAEKLPNLSTINCFSAGDILFSNIRTYFKKVWYSTFDGTVSADVLVFRTISSSVMDNMFLYLLLCSPEFTEFTVLTSKGAKMPRGDKEAIKSYNFMLPSLPEQKAIAVVLSSLDDKIDLLHRQNKTLEAMAETLFRQWFIEEAEDGWEEIILDDVIETVGGYNHNRNDLSESGSILLSMGSIKKEFGINLNNIRYIKQNISINNNLLCKPNDIFISTRDVTQNAEYLGFPGIIPDFLASQSIILGSNLYKLNLKNSNLDSIFLYNLLRSNIFREYVKNNASGTAVLMLKKNDLLKFTFKIPTERKWHSKKIIFQSIHHHLNRNLSQVVNLDKLKMTLLPKLMSGDVRIKF
ncbi:MAG: restriction endonuclease subunit S [Bacteroidaceae bacterium]|nr:restriction endonuclease subunit S [Bacteroidaceae bacterium]